MFSTNSIHSEKMRFPVKTSHGSGDQAIIHVVEDDASVREALEGLFDSMGLVCKTYKAANDLLDADLVDAHGCIVIDIRLPDMSGLELQAQLTQLKVHLPAVMMTGHGDIAMCVRAMKAGAVDFLLKPFRHQDMLDAVISGIERDRRRRDTEAELYSTRRRFDSLSGREQQVMKLVTAGKMNKQVAGDLGISEVTVKIHRGAAMKKMGARTLAELVRMADLLEPERPYSRAPGFRLVSAAPPDDHRLCKESTPCHLRD